MTARNISLAGAIASTLLWIIATDTDWVASVRFISHVSMATMVYTFVAAWRADVPNKENGGKTMSADNYIYVNKLESGLYAVSHRSASAYYADESSEPPMEGHGLVEQVPAPESTHNTLEEALIAAHKLVQTIGIVEYGVCVNPALLDV